MLARRLNTALQHADKHYEAGRCTPNTMNIQICKNIEVAGLLTERTDPKAQAAWDAEICDRIHAVDEGRVTGITYAEVLREAEGLLVP